MAILGYNTDFYGLTSSFQTDLSSSGTTSTSSFGDMATGSLSTLATAGLSTIGLGFLGPVVEGLIGELGENIDAMLKYGFSSWGASWTPEKAKAMWGETVLPLIQAKVERIGEGNIDENINDLYLELQGNYQTYNRLSRTFTARSSREAMTWAKGEVQKIIAQVLDNGIIAKLKDKGVIVKKVSFQSKVQDINGMNYLWEKPLDHRETYTFYKYQFDASNVKITPEGEVSSKSDSNLGLLGVLAFAGWKIFG